MIPVTSPANYRWLATAYLQENVASNLPSPHAINLQVNPPDTRYADDTPKIRFAQEGAWGRPLDKSHPDEPRKEEERET